MANELTTINVSLPVPMRSYLETRVKSDGYASISDLIRALIREDQKLKAKQELEQRLLTSLDSGEATEMTDEDWNRIRAEVRKKAAARKKSRK